MERAFSARDRDDDLIVRRSANAVSQTIDGRLVIVDAVDGALFDLDPIGAAIWERLDGERPLATLLDDLAARYDASPERIGRDVRAFLARLSSCGLVTVEGPSVE